MYFVRVSGIGVVFCKLEAFEDIVEAWALVLEVFW